MHAQVHCVTFFYTQSDDGFSFSFRVGYFVVADGKILVEDIVKLGTAAEAVDGDLDADVKKAVKEIA